MGDIKARVRNEVLTQLRHNKEILTFNEAERRAFIEGVITSVIAMFAQDKVLEIMDDTSFQNQIGQMIDSSRRDNN